MAPPTRGQQQLGLAKEVGELQETVGDLHNLHRFPEVSGIYRHAAPLAEGCPMCEHSDPHLIIKAGLGTKLPLLIDTSHASFGKSPLGTGLHEFPMRLRLKFGDSVVDVSVSPEDLDRPDLTVRDLLARATQPAHE